VIIGYNDKTINELKLGMQFATLCVTLLRLSFQGYVLSAASLVFCCIMKVSKIQPSLINSSAFIFESAVHSTLRYSSSAHLETENRIFTTVLIRNKPHTLYYR